MVGSSWGGDARVWSFGQLFKGLNRFWPILNGAECEFGGYLCIMSGVVVVVVVSVFFSWSMLQCDCDSLVRIRWRLLDWLLVAYTGALGIKR